MSVGLAIIDKENLYYFATDFPSIPLEQNMTAFGLKFLEGSAANRKNLQS